MKKLCAKMKAIKDWIQRSMHMSVVHMLKSLSKKYRGHCQYYGVNGNFKALTKFKWHIMYITYKTLRRRSQKRKLSFDKFIRMWDAVIFKPRIMVQIW